MALPIIFFHYGNPKYLKYSLKQAKHFNPNSTIYLLGDETNNRYPFVTHLQISEIGYDSDEFAKLYVHRSPNGELYELICFLRWFYISAFCKAQGIEAFIYLDSDVLVFDDISALEPHFKKYTIANTSSWTGVPAVTYFNSHKAISDFCNFMTYSYTNADAINRIEQLHQALLAKSDDGSGISDMTLFHLYFMDHPEKTGKIDLINNELAIDVCINIPDGYEFENGMKKVYWQNNLPYGKSLATGKLMRFIALHYQGNAKDTMRKHYKGGGYVIQQLTEPYKARFKKFKANLKASPKNKGH